MTIIFGENFSIQLNISGISSEIAFRWRLQDHIDQQDFQERQHPQLADVSETQKFL